jgi:AcrR family transcriptional regulator
MKRTKEEAEQTKKKLAEIALDTLIKEGFENVTLENVAAKAGVTRGAIYWHFNNKEDLLDYIIKTKDVESIEIMDRISKSDAAPMEKIDMLISGNFPKLKKQSEMKNYARLKMDLYNYYLKYGDNRNIGKTFTKHLAAFIKQAQADGIIKKDVNVNESAYVIFCLIGGLYLRLNQQSSEYKTLQSIHGVVKNYLKQLETRQG